jgi:Cu(I)/Ag(I) efflux system membrane fusion protein/cobalt-zinc-cadmium efflux system membrane fusion protein
MPEMGMAEMNSTVGLSDRSNGIYSGQLELGSGGTWQVTLTADQGGRLILTKRLNVTATGGM